MIRKPISANIGATLLTAAFSIILPIVGHAQVVGYPTVSSPGKLMSEDERAANVEWVENGGAWGKAPKGYGMSVLPGRAAMGMTAPGVGFIPSSRETYDLRIVPKPSGPAAKDESDRLKHLNDSLAANDEARRQLNVEYTAIQTAQNAAWEIRKKLSPDAQADHDDQYTDPYQKQMTDVLKRRFDNSIEFGQLLKERVGILSRQQSSSGYVVMTPDDREKAQSEGFTCGEGLQSVKQIKNDVEYACLTSDGYLAKTARLWDGKVFSEATYVRENGKLVRIVVENDGKMMSEIVFEGNKPQTKYFSKGAEVGSCQSLSAQPSANQIIRDAIRR